MSANVYFQELQIFVEVSYKFKKHHRNKRKRGERLAHTTEDMGQF